MSNLVKWWDGRSTLEKAGLGAVGLALGGAVVWAVAAEGAIVVAGGTIIAVGKAATELARRG